MKKHEAFKVEMESMGCRCCGKGSLWMVVGPNEVGTGVSYANKEDAEETAGELNYAFDLGVKYGRKK